LRTLIMRNGECGVRNEDEAADVGLPFTPRSAFRIPHLKG